ncbi:MAG TPA: hypothetical protein VFA15_06675, partial [Nitrososphaera sp.]|nr:hypothetical protein [Nitrososphaera sp.]
NKVFSEFATPFSRIDAVGQVKRTLSALEFDTSRILFDTSERKNKYPSPICFFVQIPSDIRILFKSESPYFDLQGCYHETGHAIHASSIDSGAKYWDRYGFSMGIAEVFSIFLERLTKNRRYLQHIGITDSLILDALEERNRFMELYFVCFYAANSLMKAEYWQKSLSIEGASERYAKLQDHYTGLPLPGKYWMLHHILPDSVMYVPSYLVAAVRAAELERRVEERFGEDWWTQRLAGNYLREVMKPGAKVDLTEFSKLDKGVYLRQIGA